MAMDKGNQKQGIHSRKTRNKFFKIFLLQALLCITLSIILLIDNLVTSYSALLGGGIYLLPMIYSAHRALTFSHKQSAEKALVQMYMSQIWKMGLSVAAFAAVFILIHPLNPFSLFGTFILMQVTAWFAQMRINKRFLKL